MTPEFACGKAVHRTIKRKCRMQYSLQSITVVERRCNLSVHCRCCTVAGVHLARHQGASKPSKLVLDTWCSTETVMNRNSPQKKRSALHKTSGMLTTQQAVGLTTCHAQHNLHGKRDHTHAICSAAYTAAAAAKRSSSCQHLTCAVNPTQTGSPPIQQTAVCASRRRCPADCQWRKQLVGS